MKLVLDVGGTKTRIGVWNDRKIVHRTVFQTSKIKELITAITQFLASLEIKPDNFEEVLVAIAAPITSDEVKLTNNNLVVKKNNLENAFPRARIWFINDMEALGWFIYRYLADDITTVIVGLGTGFGLTAVSKQENKISVLPSEYGHRYPSFELEKDEILFAKGLGKETEVELFLSGKGIAIQFVSKLISFTQEIRDTISREAVTDTILRTLLENPDTYTRFVFDIGELNRHGILRDTGLKGLQEDDLHIRKEEVHHGLISNLQISGGMVGPLLHLLSLNQLEEMAGEVLDRFESNLNQELRNIILTFLPKDCIYFFGSVANRLDFEKLKIDIQKTQNKQFSDLISIEMKLIDDEDAILKGLIEFTSQRG